MSKGLEEVIDETESSQPQANCNDFPGAILSARRQSLGLSIEQVADQIKLAPRQILAIESDDYAALPPMVVTRGFIRSYAKCLKMDATPLLTLIRPEPASHISQASLRRADLVSFSAGKFPSMQGSDGALSKWNLGVIFLVLLLLSALLAQRMGWLPDLSKITIDSSLNRDQSVSGKASTISESKPIVTSSDIKEMNVVSSPALVQVPTLIATDAPIVPATTAPEILNVVDEKNQLVLQARQDSWIEIKRADKSIIFSRILKSGEVKEFTLIEPVLLIIGNVAGIDATLRGNILNTKAGINGNVAKLNLK